MKTMGRVLIADDEETFLLSTADLLRERGYECECARDADTGARLIGAHGYDVLVADVKMPGNSELQFVRELPKLADGIPTILVTGYPELNSAIHAIELRVMAYMVKPLDFEELLARIRTSVQHARLGREVRDARKRSQDRWQQLRDFETEVQSGTDDVAEVDVATFLTLTLTNIVAGLGDLKQLTESLAVGTSTPDACHLLQCPRPVQLRRAVQDAIEVLEHTKGHFKSKDLGALRGRLEAVLENT